MSDTTNDKKTLRDEFAMEAMNGILSNGEIPDGMSKSTAAATCYAIADAMLAERAK